MIRVQSLKRTIIAQFLVILVPLVALLAYQTIQGTYNAQQLEQRARFYDLAANAKRQYAHFDASATAAEAGPLEQRAIAALWEARHALDELGLRAEAPELRAQAKVLSQLADALEADPTVYTLHAYAGTIESAAPFLEAVVARFDRQLKDHIDHTTENSSTDSAFVSMVSVIMMLVTIFFVFHMVHHLSQPLELAVAIADRIAAGEEVPDRDFNLQIDVGNLLHSLKRMSHSLRNYREEANRHRHGLEEKVRQLAHSQASLAEAQRLAHIGNWRWDTAQPVGEWSDETYRVLGLEPGACEPTWSNFLKLVDAADLPRVEEGFRRLLRAPSTFALEHYITLPDGMYRCVHNNISSRAGADGRVVQMHGTLQDITERKAAEDKMHYLAMYDALTGLPNRQLHHDQLERSVNRAQRDGSNLAVMFIDLDRFKRINDTLGHATGDLLLKEVASRLSGCLRASDYIACEHGAGENGPVDRVARLAGDEFTITLDTLRDPKDAARVAQRILAELARPFVLNGEEVVVTASVGIAIFPQDGQQAAMLLKNADAAMYQAKQLGKNTYQFFAGEMNAAAVARLKMESDLRHALERGELCLHYQPKIDVLSDRIAGVEALMRWQHPERGMVSPGQFIPVAEEAGLIVEMGEWVLEEACRQMKAWRDAGLPDIEMAINLASPSFRQPDLVARVAAALRQNGVEPSRLCLEATESILMRDADATLTTLRALRELGVKLSVDDFGTGYSSLSYLHRFPLHQLKIDRSFVNEVTVSSDDAAIVAAIVSLANTLKLEVVAEGVETLDQVHRLIDQGCRVMQGFYFSKPLPAQDLTNLLRSGIAFSGRSKYAIHARADTALVA